MGNILALIARQMHRSSRNVRWTAVLYTPNWSFPNFSLHKTDGPAAAGPANRRGDEAPSPRNDNLFIYFRAMPPPGQYRFASAAAPGHYHSRLEITLTRTGPYLSIYRDLKLQYI